MGNYFTALPVASFVPLASKWTTHRKGHIFQEQPVKGAMWYI